MAERDAENRTDGKEGKEIDQSSGWCSVGVLLQWYAKGRVQVQDLQDQAESKEQLLCLASPVRIR